MPVVTFDGAYFGRQEELAKLAACARAARSGQPWTVLVEAEPGMGKTALLREWLSRSDLDGFVVLRAHCGSFEQDRAFGLVARLLSSVHANVRQGEVFRSAVETVTPASDPIRVGAHLLAVFSELQEHGPVALVVDDAQWADAQSADALRFAISRLEADASLTVLALRPAERGFSSGRAVSELHRLVRDSVRGCYMRLQGLDVVELAALARHAVGLPLGTAAVQRLHAHTEGHPLYALSVLGEVKPEGLAGSSSPLPIPESLAAAIRGQLEVLPDDSRALVEAAAVLDLRSPLHVVAGMANVFDPSEALNPLVGNGLMQWWPGEASTPVAIRHALQRDVVLSTIMPSKLRQLHLRATASVSRQRPGVTGSRRQNTATPSWPVSSRLQPMSVADVASPATPSRCCAGRPRLPRPERTRNDCYSTPPCTWHGAISSAHSNS